VIDRLLEISVREIFDSLPSNFVTLKDALGGKLEIRLRNGLTHFMSGDEVRRASEMIPSHLWSAVKLPFLLVKTMSPGEYLVSGDEVTALGVSLLVGKTGTQLNILEVQKLLRDFASLVFITIGISETLQENFEQGL